MSKKFNLHHGDCLAVLRTLPDNSVDSFVTDPPYGLNFMGKRWDSTVPPVEVWSECLRVLKPGGYLLAFAGTRTQHRMATRIEDAGFEIRDMIAWVYGSGFPKSLDVSKAIDKAAGAEREVVGVKSVGNGNRKGEGFRHEGDQAGIEVTAPATEAAQQWEGWGTAMKPALEPITVARKPLIGTVAANVLAHGTGALNIDGCRVGSETRTNASKPSADRNGFIDGFVGGTQSQTHDHGRWPANLIHDGSAEVLAQFPSAPGQQGKVTGNEPTANGFSGAVKFGGMLGRVESSAPRVEIERSAARFFYCAKASRADRNEGTENLTQRTGGMVSNTSGQHITRRDEGYEAKPQGNNHPTVKPTDLMRYLIRLVTPPGGITADIYMGSGSSGKAALLEGFQFIGIEKDADSFAIATARIEYEARAGYQPPMALEAA